MDRENLEGHGAHQDAEETMVIKNPVARDLRTPSTRSGWFAPRGARAHTRESPALSDFVQMDDWRPKRLLAAYVKDVCDH